MPREGAPRSLAADHHRDGACSLVFSLSVNASFSPLFLLSRGWWKEERARPGSVDRRAFQRSGAVPRRANDPGFASSLEIKRRGMSRGVPGGSHSPRPPSPADRPTRATSPFPRSGPRPFAASAINRRRARVLNSDADSETGSFFLDRAPQHLQIDNKRRWIPHDRNRRSLNERRCLPSLLFIKRSSSISNEGRRSAACMLSNDPSSSSRSAARPTQLYLVFRPFPLERRPLLSRRSSTSSTSSSSACKIQPEPRFPGGATTHIAPRSRVGGGGPRRKWRNARTLHVCWHLERSVVRIRPGGA